MKATTMTPANANPDAEAHRLLAGAPRGRIGIITGSGPEAGVDLWNKVLRANRALLGERYRGDIDAPEAVIFSVPELGLSMELERNDAEVWRHMATTASRLAQHVDHYAIACNTLNYYAKRLAALQLPAALVSVADVVIEHLKAHRVDRVALLGARPVMDLGPWSPYRPLLEHVEVEVPADVEGLHRIIYDVKRLGGAHADIPERFARVLNGLRSEVVLLACTELPLIPMHGGSRRPIDVTDLLASALAQRSLEAPPARRGGTPLNSDPEGAS